MAAWSVRGRIRRLGVSGLASNRKKHTTSTKPNDRA